MSQDIIFIIVTTVINVLSRKVCSHIETYEDCFTTYQITKDYKSCLSDLYIDRDYDDIITR